MIDLVLFYVRCLGLFHRWVRQDLGESVRLPPMVCTRCGTLDFDR